MKGPLKKTRYGPCRLRLEQGRLRRLRPDGRVWTTRNGGKKWAELPAAPQHRRPVDGRREQRLPEIPGYPSDRAAAGCSPPPTAARPGVRSCSGRHDARRLETPAGTSAFSLGRRPLADLFTHRRTAVTWARRRGDGQRVAEALTKGQREAHRQGVAERDRASGALFSRSRSDALVARRLRAARPRRLVLLHGAACGPPRASSRSGAATPTQRRRLPVTTVSRSRPEKMKR